MEEEEGKVIHPPSTPAKKAPFEKRRKEPALHKRRMSEWTIYRPQRRCVYLPKYAGEEGPGSAQVGCGGEWPCGEGPDSE